MLRLFRPLRLSRKHHKQNSDVSYFCQRGGEPLTVSPFLLRGCSWPSARPLLVGRFLKSDRACRLIRFASEDVQSWSRVAIVIGEEVSYLLHATCAATRDFVPEMCLLATGTPSSGPGQTSQGLFRAEIHFGRLVESGVVSTSRKHSRSRPLSQREQS